MKSKNDAKLWFPIYVDKWLFGSTRLELEPDERSVWVDLLALSQKDHGWVRANENMPYSREQLAGMLVIPIDLLNRTIDKCMDEKINKIKMNENGTFFLVNWKEFAFTDRYKRKINSSEKAEQVDQKAEPIIYNSIKKDKIKKNKIKHKYGEYKNVLLTNEELEKLNNDYEEKKTNSAIEYLSLYKAEKPYKTKSDYLTIKRWVFKAIDEKKSKPKSRMQKTYDDAMEKYGDQI